MQHTTYIREKLKIRKKKKKKKEKKKKKFIHHASMFPNHNVNQNHLKDIIMKV